MFTDAERRELVERQSFEVPSTSMRAAGLKTDRGEDWMKRLCSSLSCLPSLLDLGTEMPRRTALRRD